MQTFPQEQRYVALFADKTSEPKAPDADAPDRAQQKAADFLKSIRRAVKKGALSKEPEVQLEEREEASRQKAMANGTKRQAQDNAAKSGLSSLSKQPKHSAGSISHKAQREPVDTIGDKIEKDFSDSEQELSDPQTSSEASNESSENIQVSDSESSDEGSDENRGDHESIPRSSVKASQSQVHRRNKAESRSEHASSVTSSVRASTPKQSIAGDDFFAT